jgi:hypothetical protein
VNFSFLSSTCTIGPYIYLVGFVWQRSAAQRTARCRLLNLASSTAVNQTVGGCGHGAIRYAATHHLSSKAATPPPPPSQRVFVLKSDLSSSVSGWCGDMSTEVPTEFPQKRQLHAQPRQLYFKLLSLSRSHCLIFASTSASCPPGAIGAIVG